MASLKDLLIKLLPSAQFHSRASSILSSKQQTSAFEWASGKILIDQFGKAEPNQLLYNLEHFFSHEMTDSSIY